MRITLSQTTPNEETKINNDGNTRKYEKNGKATTIF